MSNLHTKVVTAEHEFAELAHHWQQLASQDEHATIFNDWHWNSLWWKHYRHLGELYVLLVYRGTDLVGIAPLYSNNSIAMRLFKQRTVRFIGTGGDTSPDDVNIIALPECRLQVANSVWDHLLDAKFDRIMCSDVPLFSDFYKIGLQRLSDAPGYVSKPIVQTRRCAALPHDWAGFRAQISRNTHKQIKRRQNRLDAAGTIRFHLCESVIDCDMAFHALVRLHRLRWQAKSQTGAFSTDAYCQFHQELITELAKQQQVWLITLSDGDKVIAVEYTYVHKNTLMFFQTGFDPAYEQLSPGHVLMTYAIKQAIDVGISRIDLLKGDYEYKNSYADAELQSVNFTYYSQRIVGMLGKLRDYLN